MINDIIDDLESFGLPEKKQPSPENSHINITVNQSATQDLKISFNVILSALQEELSGKQLKELQDIIDNKEEPKKKKDRIIDKIKSFGTDVAASILSNILSSTLTGG